MHKIAVAVSGGVDSITAAYLLKKKGHHVLGIHFTTGFESNASIEKARQTAQNLGIELIVYDAGESFKSKVVDYFALEYSSGRTPNPCLVCNPAIKFGEVFEVAQKHGAVKFATGHYARTALKEDGTVKLLRGNDPKKDQTYFLAFLTQQMLRNTIFPLGELTKEEVKQIAFTEKLLPVEDCGQESQDICFIPNGKYVDFLTSQKGFSFPSGPVCNLEGKKVGEHSGLHRFTVGQRRGINIPGPHPYYVISLVPEKNMLIIGPEEALYKTEFFISRTNWITSMPLNSKGFEGEVKIRFRQEAVEAFIKPMDTSRAKIVLHTPKSAVTPGQGAVIYSGDEIMGGGFID